MGSTWELQQAGMSNLNGMATPEDLAGIKKRPVKAVLSKDLLQQLSDA